MMGMLPDSGLLATDVPLVRTLLQTTSPSRWHFKQALRPAPEMQQSNGNTMASTHVYTPPHGILWAHMPMHFLLTQANASASSVTAGSRATTS
jgi:hypothetical protein